MKIQYDVHGRKKRVSVNVLDASKTSLAISDSDRKVAAAIIRRYFQISRETVLAGYDWKFPNGILLGIREERINGVYGISRYRRGEDGRKLKVKNPGRINMNYTIDMTGPILSVRRYRYESNSDFRKKLTLALFNTDVKYSKKVR